jgi:uncharacterized membrane protein YphA (DoxX/SURF4 family)
VNVFLWIVQILLAAAFLGAGLTKISQPRAKLQTNMSWVEDFSDNNVKLIGAAEVLGAIGLVLPWLTGIAKVLTPLAALCLAVAMAGAVYVHIRRKEVPRTLPAAVLLVLSLVVAIGRF